MRLVRARTLQLWRVFVALLLPAMILAHAQGGGTTGFQHYNGHFNLKREISRLRAKLNAAEEAIDSLKWQLHRCRRGVRGVNESRHLSSPPARPESRYLSLSPCDQNVCTDTVKVRCLPLQHPTRRTRITWANQPDVPCAVS